MSNGDYVTIGELTERMRANQYGLLSLFNSVGLPVEDGIVKLRDLARLRHLAFDRYEDAILLLYPETKAEASPISIHKDGIESSQERYDRLGIDGSYKYVADYDNYEGLQSQLVSYKTILKWLMYLAVAVGVSWLLWYFYKRMK